MKDAGESRRFSSFRRSLQNLGVRARREYTTDKCIYKYTIIVMSYSRARGGIRGVAVVVRVVLLNRFRRRQTSLLPSDKRLYSREIWPALYAECCIAPSMDVL